MGELGDLLLLLRLERQAEKGGNEWIGLVRLVAERLREMSPQLQARACLRVGDAEVEPAPQLLAHRPIRDCLGVRDAVSSQKADALAEMMLRLGYQARLPDSRLAVHGHDRAFSAEEPFEAGLERRELIPAT